MPYLACYIVYAFSLGNHTCYHHIISLFTFIILWVWICRLNTKLPSLQYFFSYFSYLIFFKPSYIFKNFDRQFSVCTHTVVTNLLDSLFYIILCLLFIFFVGSSPPYFLSLFLFFFLLQYGILFFCSQWYIKQYDSISISSSIMISP